MIYSVNIDATNISRYFKVVMTAMTMRRVDTLNECTGSAVIVYRYRLYINSYQIANAFTKSLLKSAKFPNKCQERPDIIMSYIYRLCA